MCQEVGNSRHERDNAPANIFARRILLPEEEFRAAVRESGNVVELAEKFKCSTLLIRIRAKELNMTGHGL